MRDMFGSILYVWLLQDFFVRQRLQFQLDLIEKQVCSYSIVRSIIREKGEYLACCSAVWWQRGQGTLVRPPTEGGISLHWDNHRACAPAWRSLVWQCWRDREWSRWVVCSFQRSVKSQGLRAFPVVYDPASFYGHHEYELGIASMFGGFSRDFYDAYHSLIPKAPGFSTRLKLYSLFHYLNHWSVCMCVVV